MLLTFSALVILLSCYVCSLEEHQYLQLFIDEKKNQHLAVDFRALLQKKMNVKFLQQHPVFNGTSSRQDLFEFDNYLVKQLVIDTRLIMAATTYL